MQSPQDGNGKRIAVIGAGAVGQFYAARLSAVHPITLLTRRKDAVKMLRSIVIKPEGQGAQRYDDIRVGTLDERGYDRQPYDVIILAVAAYDTAAVAPVVDALLAPNGLCLTIQNGMNNAAVLKDLVRSAQVMQGATTFTTSSPRAGLVVLGGAGATWMPTLPPHLSWLQSRLAAAGLNPAVGSDSERVTWQKMVMSPNGYLCLILAKPFRDLSTSPSARAILQRAMLEIAMIAEASGIIFDCAELIKQQQSLIDDYANAQSSFYSHYAAGRKTELEERLGDLIRHAERLHVDVPVLVTLHLLCKARLESEASAIGTDNPRQWRCQ